MLRFLNILELEDFKYCFILLKLVSRIGWLFRFDIPLDQQIGLLDRTNQCEGSSTSFSTI